MEIPARYYAKLKDGTCIYVCSQHASKIAIDPDGSGHLLLRRSVKFAGTLSQYTKKKCVECRK